MRDAILILDYGSQYTQLIARRVPALRLAQFAFTGSTQY